MMLWEHNKMSKASLVSSGGIAAILAGILRGIASFIPATTPDAALQLLYILTERVGAVK